MDYTIKQVAEKFGVHKITVFRWLKAGFFPNAHKLTPGGKTSRYLIPEGDIILFEEKQRQGKQPEK